MSLQSILGLFLFGWAAVTHAARIDHVVIATMDVEASARALSDKYGLAAAGRPGYNGNGLKTIVVPVGSSFLQLVELTPQAAASKNPYNMAIKDAAQPGGSEIVTFAIAPSEDFRALSERLHSQDTMFRSPEAIGTYPAPSWNVTGAESILTPPLPVFVNWAGEEQQSGEAMAAVTKAVNRGGAAPVGIAYLELAGDVAKYNKWVGSNTVPVRWSQESVAPGVVSVVIDRGDGTQTVLKAGQIFAPTA